MYNTLIFVSLAMSLATSDGYVVNLHIILFFSEVGNSANMSKTVGQTVLFEQRHLNDILFDAWGILTEPIHHT